MVSKIQTKFSKNVGQKLIRSVYKSAESYFLFQSRSSQRFFIKFYQFKYIKTLYFRSVNALVYNGLSLNSVSLSGNKFLNFILVSLIEIPGYTITWVFVNEVKSK